MWVVTLRICFLITYLLLSVQSVPIEPSNTTSSNEVVENNGPQSYDISQFDEVYDQRQNGSFGNLRINLNKIAVIYTPPGSLLTAALLLDPALWEFDEESGVSDFFVPDKPQPPQPGQSVTKPETTTVPDVSTEATSGTSSTQTSTKRKLKVPSGLIRSFMRRLPQRQPQ